ncbi:hypothetical protein [Acetobacter sp.]|uniref:hypothetical protein n=1 Tax=Acetobacter sp. TaxID=440 RepID=UPI0039E89738
MIGSVLGMQMPDRVLPELLAWSGNHRRIWSVLPKAKKAISRCKIERAPRAEKSNEKVLFFIL